MDRLTVRWDEKLVGHIYPLLDDFLKFEYSDSWLSQGFSAISCSLPTTQNVFDPKATTCFFENLQHEGPALGELFDLAFDYDTQLYRYLSRFGLDCAAR
jgi:HipA-like protein